jgi:DNA-binding NarL/FixJ family response regulator
LFARQKAEIGLVILDLSMPKMTGDEVLREIKKLAPDTPVILTSGYSENDALRRIPRGQLAGFIKKPYRADLLLERVRAALGQPADHRG